MVQLDPRLEGKGVGQIQPAGIRYDDMGAGAVEPECGAGIVGRRNIRRVGDIHHHRGRVERIEVAIRDLVGKDIGVFGLHRRLVHQAPRGIADQRRNRINRIETAILPQRAQGRERRDLGQQLAGREPALEAAERDDYRVGARRVDTLDPRAGKDKGCAVLERGRVAVARGIHDGSAHAIVHSPVRRKAGLAAHQAVAILGRDFR